MARIVVVGALLDGLFAANMRWPDGRDVHVLDKVQGSMSGHDTVACTHWLGAALDGLAPPGTVDRPRQAIAETAIDLGRYGHRSAFPPAATAPHITPYAA